MNIDFKKLADKYQTPYYVYDFDYISNQYNELKTAFKAKKIFNLTYAVKANSKFVCNKTFGKSWSRSRLC